MEHETMSMQEQIMSMMNGQLEMLEVEFDDAERALGRAANAKETTRSNENYSEYWDKNLAYDICKEKLQLMRKIIDRVSMVFDSQTPMLANVRM